MKKDSERFSRDVIWNLISVCILGISGFSLNIILVRYYGAETFGAFSQVLAAYYIFSQLSVGGFVFSTLSHVATYSNDREIVRVIITSALILTALLSLFVGITAFFLSGWIGQMFDSESVRKGILCIVPGLLFFSINKILLFSINGLRHMRFYAFGNSLRFILILLSLIVLTIFRVDGTLLPMCFSIAEFILLPVLATYIFYQYPPSVMNIKNWFSSHLHFGGKTFFSGLLMDINLKVDVILLGYYFSDKAVGIYSFASMWAIEGLLQFIIAIQMNINPLLNHLKLEDLRKYIRKSILILCPSMALLACLIGFLFPYITILLTGNPDFIAGRIYFVVLMTGIVIGSSYLPFIYVLNQWGYPGWFMIFLLSIVVTNIILNALLIPYYGALGAAIGTGLSYVMIIVYLEIFLRVAINRAAKK